MRKFTALVLGVMILFSAGGAFATGTQEAGRAVAAPDNFNATGLPIVDERVTITIAAMRGALHSKSFNEMAVVRAFEDATNIRVEWDEIAQPSYPEVTNLMFASGDLPDAMFPFIRVHGHEDLLMPLNDLIDAYAPRITEVFAEMPNARRSATNPDDGNIYALPRVNAAGANQVPYMMYMNSEWLNNVGMTIPGTTDELYDVLRAFREYDLTGSGRTDDEIPLSFLAPDIAPLFAAFGLEKFPNNVTTVGDTVVFVPNKPEYRAALEYFHRLYSEGLMDLEVFTQDARQLAAKGNNGLLGAFVNWNDFNVIGSDMAASGLYELVLPLEGPNGDRGWNAFDNSVQLNAFAISARNPHPEATIRWIDTLWEEDWSIQWSRGPFGVTIERNADGTIDRMPTPSGMSYGEFRNSESIANTAPWVITAALDRRFGQTAESQRYQSQVDQYTPFLPEKVFTYLFTPAQQDRLAILGTDIGTYVERMQAEFIVNGVTDSDWNNYTRQLDRMGLAEYVEIHQASHDAFFGIR